MSKLLKILGIGTALAGCGIAMGRIEHCDVCGRDHWGDICPKIGLGLTGHDPRDYKGVCDYRDIRIYLDHLGPARSSVEREAQAALAMHYQWFIEDLTDKVLSVELRSIPELIEWISLRIQRLGGNPADFGIIQPHGGYGRGDGYECDDGYGCGDGYGCRGSYGWRRVTIDDVIQFIRMENQSQHLNWMMISVNGRLSDIQQGRALPYDGHHREVVGGYDDISNNDVYYFINTEDRIDILRMIRDAIAQRQNEL